MNNIVKNNNIKLSFRIRKNNNEYLENIAKEYNISKNELINQLIEFSKKNNNVFRLDNNKSSYKIFKEVRIKLSEDEFDFLKKEQNNHAFKSLSKEIKFRINNTIYNNAFFTNIEMQELLKNNADINKLGRNLNELVRFIKSKSNQNIELDDGIFKDMLLQIKEYLEKNNSFVLKCKKDIELRLK